MLEFCPRDAPNNDHVQTLIYFLTNTDYFLGNRIGTRCQFAEPKREMFANNLGVKGRDCHDILVPFIKKM